VRYKAIAALAAAMAMVAGGTAEARSALATRYQRGGLFGGYSEKEIEPGVWRVSASANAPAGRGFGVNMALYRAAELMKEQGYSHVQFLDGRGTETTMRNGGAYLNQRYRVVVRGAHGPAAPTDCRAEDPANCTTMPVAQVMARLAPLLELEPPAGVPAQGGSPAAECSPRDWRENKC